MKLSAKYYAYLNLLKLTLGDPIPYPQVGLEITLVCLHSHFMPFGALNLVLGTSGVKYSV